MRDSTQADQYTIHVTSMQTVTVSVYSSTGDHYQVVEKLSKSIARGNCFTMLFSFEHLHNLNCIIKAVFFVILLLVLAVLHWLDRCSS